MKYHNTPQEYLKSAALSEGKQLEQGEFKRQVGNVVTFPPPRQIFSLQTAARVLIQYPEPLRIKKD
jgi:hypothetical protein